MRHETPRSPRRQDALSRERIVAAAVELLDATGENDVTFRALAERLATGAGAIYHHVANKDELLAAAASAIIAEATARADDAHDPREAIRDLGLALFDAMDAHPWVASQLSREPWRLGSTQIFEALGSRLDALGIPPALQFTAASTLAGYVIGAAGQNAAHARSVPRGMDRTTYLQQATERWNQLDPAAYPFVRRTAASLPDHDDREQFLTGLDLVLAGIQSGR